GNRGVTSAPAAPTTHPLRYQRLNRRQTTPPKRCRLETFGSQAIVLLLHSSLFGHPRGCRNSRRGLSVVRCRYAGASFPADMRRRVTRRNSARPACMAPYRPRMKEPSACEAEAKSEPRRLCWSSWTNWTHLEGSEHTLRPAWRIRS